MAGVEAELLRRVRARGGLSRVELAGELRLAPQRWAFMSTDSPTRAS